MNRVEDASAAQRQSDSSLSARDQLEPLVTWASPISLEPHVRQERVHLAGADEGVACCGRPDNGVAFAAVFRTVRFLD